MRWSNVRPVLCMAVLFVFALGLVGCGAAGKEFTPDEFKKISKGDPESKVTEVCGGAYDSVKTKDGKVSYYKVKEQYYIVRIKDDKVESAAGPTTKDAYQLSKGLAAAMAQKGM